jgi:hypothetical protein
MTRSLFGSVSFLVLLGFLNVSAQSLTCTPISRYPDNIVCGTTGFIDNSNYYIGDYYDAEDLTLEGCASTCYANGNCVSFLLNQDE